MSETYKIENKVVTKEQYDALVAQLENKQLHLCVTLIDGGKSTSVATHKTNGKKYTMVFTQRGNGKTYDISEGEPANI